MYKVKLEGEHWVVYLWWVKLQSAINTGRHARQDDAGISFKALCPPINKGDDGAGIQDSFIIAQERYLEIHK